MQGITDDQIKVEKIEALAQEIQAHDKDLAEVRPVDVACVGWRQFVDWAPSQQQHALVGQDSLYATIFYYFGKRLKRGGRSPANPPQGFEFYFDQDLFAELYAAEAAHYQARLSNPNLAEPGEVAALSFIKPFCNSATRQSPSLLNMFCAIWFMKI